MNQSKRKTVDPASIFLPSFGFRPRLLDWLPERPHPFCRNRLGNFAGSAQNERAEILVPIAVGRVRASPHPILQTAEVA